MKIIRCLIVDDEPLAREIIQTYLKHIPNWEVVKTCINAEEAYEALMQNGVDVLFLDIQMPVISGIDFLRSLKNPPLVVFTTAYSHYAVEGFALHAADYLLKPITLSRFFQAVERVQELLALKQNPLQSTPEKPVYIFVKHNGRLIKIYFDEIQYIRAEKDFSTVYLTDKKLLLSMHLKLLEAALPAEMFFRVHRSYIINAAKITSIYGNMVFIGDAEIPIGANYKEDLYQKLHISGS
ncbi:LytR/AlgR family response regulator transcription factor [Adhaeribacter rhizoryzae]|uniref:Response regulator transcription factor n=1 Tax=Adhaeribacter rhizoryzae TaxID=2607907 RepID=A0A5M6D4U0_9BACT|nr:response regulator transcription factor [Adhaeribacter rhizoryzae]KAA5542501.1 response regulator transcription factor [Adhaeribacter rhizoryzae]